MGPFLKKGHCPRFLAPVHPTPNRAEIPSGLYPGFEEEVSSTAPVIVLIIGKEGLLDEIGAGNIYNWGKGKPEATIYCASTDTTHLGIMRASLKLSIMLMASPSICFHSLKSLTP